MTLIAWNRVIRLSDGFANDVRGVDYCPYVPNLWRALKTKSELMIASDRQRHFNSLSNGSKLGGFEYHCQGMVRSHRYIMDSRTSTERRESVLHNHALVNNLNLKTFGFH